MPYLPISVSAASRFAGPFAGGLSVFQVLASRGAQSGAGYASTKAQAEALAIAAVESGAVELVEKECVEALNRVRQAEALKLGDQFRPVVAAPKPEPESKPISKPAAKSAAKES